MKIQLDPSMGVRPSADPIRTKSDASSDTASFSECLTSAMQQDATSETVSDTTLIQPAVSIPSALFIGQGQDQGRETITRGIGNMLDTLDAYQGLLSSPTATLKEMAPLVEQIETDVKSLSSLGVELGENSPLKDILNQTLVTASVEISRFNRGDYISS